MRLSSSDRLNIQLPHLLGRYFRICIASSRQISLIRNALTFGNRIRHLGAEDKYIEAGNRFVHGLDAHD